MILHPLDAGTQAGGGERVVLAPEPIIIAWMLIDDDRRVIGA